MTDTQKVYVFDVLEPHFIADIKEPTLTITPQGLFRLNKSAHDAMTRPATVELLYDAVNTTIGIRATDANNPKARVVFRGGNTDRAAVSGMGLMRRIGLSLPDRPTKITGRAVGGVLIFNVSRMSENDTA